MNKIYNLILYKYNFESIFPFSFDYNFYYCSINMIRIIVLKLKDKFRRIISIFGLELKYD